MKKGSYIVVTGEKGNGKTCLIDTTLNRHFGVVKISVSCLFYSIVDYVNVK
jgi:guanylate kinase